jgi:heavy metal translocating P-type ATPase
MKTPYLFDEFFASGLEESISPFLTTGSKSYGKNLKLKSAFTAAIFLTASFAASFTHPSLSYFLLSFVYFFVGTPALIAAINDLKNFEVNIDILMTLAAFVAIFIDSGLEGALLLVLFELSHGMEDAVSRKTHHALHDLNRIAPKFGFVVSPEGTVYAKKVSDIMVGEELLIKNGEIAPLDGIITEGNSSVDLVHLTGESFPVLKTVGDLIPGGARNLEGILKIKVTKTSSESTLSKIIQLIIQAHENKPSLQKILDRFGKYYASTIILLSGFFMIFLPWMFSIDYLGPSGSIYRALAFLIAASPCALIIATPTAYLSAISACARKGILLKGGITLDALASCSMIAFDKTGTLTTGELTCCKIEPIKNTTRTIDEALSVAFGLERQIVHPIATAICNLAIEKKIAPARIEDFQSIPGFGLKGIYQSVPVTIGLAKHVTSEEIKNIVEEGFLVAVLMIDQDLFIFRFQDFPRAGAKEMIQLIQTQNHLLPVMLTGDHEQNAKQIGKLLYIDAVFADLRPEDKLAKVTELSQNQGLAMVGDGMNDAPALARATVGISMGKMGSASAIDASDVILLNDDLSSISWLFTKAKQTLQIVKQNIALALFVICFITTPALLGLIPLWVAVLLHEGGTLLVGLNSLRLLKK